MYKEFYGLKQEPFSLSPDPKFLFLSEKHADAFKYLSYGIEKRKGFILVTGEVGTGKTTLCRALLDELGDRVKSALILDPHLDQVELLEAIIKDLGMKVREKTKKELIQQINGFLLKELEAGGNVVLIIDEAQGLSSDLLEQIRLLSNLETEKEKLLQIILVGQPELEVKLSQPGLRQLNQRIAIRYHLESLGRRETRKYISHRLRVAGERGELLFTPRAVGKIFAYSKGIPRVINMVCDRALVAGYYSGAKKITPHLVSLAIQNLQGRFPPRFRMAWGIASVAMLLILGMVWRFQGEILRFPKSLINPPPPLKVAREREKPPQPPGEMSKEDSRKGLGPQGIMRIEEGVNSCEITSLATLLKLWGVRGDLVVEAKTWSQTDNFSFREIAQGYGLEANYFRTDTERLRIWNLPCILLDFVDKDLNRSCAVILLGFSEDQAIIGDPWKGRLRISWDELKNRWEGRAIILWKNPEGMTSTLRLGMGGEEVRSLERHLRKLGYFEGIPPIGTYDWNMRQAVMHFQSEHALRVDGIVGPQTKMILYSLLDQPFIPRLN